MKSVWLRNPFGDPKKTEFKVTESEISLGNFVVPASKVHSCKVGYAKKWLGPLTIAIGLGLTGWFLYEAMSFLIRLLTAINVASTPEVDEAATQASMVQLLLGALLFVLPFIGDLTIAERLPKFSFVYRLIPQRTFKVIVMVFVGALFGAWMQGLFSSPADFLKWSFVLLAIPGLIFSVLEWFSDAPDKDWKESKSGRWTYRILGVIIFLLTVQMVRGVDLSAWILGLSSG